MSDPTSASAPAPTSSESTSAPMPGESAEAHAARLRDPATGRFTTAPAEPPPRYKVNIDGTEEEWELPKILSSVQLAQASHRRFQEAAAARKQLEAERSELAGFLQKARQNPEILFQALGIDRRQWAERQVSEMIQEESLTPEQREIAQYRRERAAWEAQRRREAEAREHSQLQAQTQRHFQDYQTNFTKALESSGIAATPANLRRMADMALVDLDAGQPIDPATLAMRLQEELHGETSSWLSSLDDDRLLKVVGRERFDRLRAREVEALRQAPSTFQQGMRSAGVDTSSEAPSKQTWEELFGKRP